MSTQETIDRQAGAPLRHCEHCGEQRSGGRFCAGCGHETAGGRTAGPAPTQTKRSGLLIAAALVALLAIGGAAVAYVLMRDGAGKGDGDRAYRRALASTFGPVLGGNRGVSRDLSRLRGPSPTNARASVRRAQEATKIATGAVGALTVPAGAEQLARDTRQVLGREDAYLSGVAAVLAKPSSPTRSQLQTLASDLTGALNDAGPTVAGTSQTVYGADRLVAWATRHHKRTPRKGGKVAAPPSPAAGSTPTQPGTTCGGGLFAGPNTSCTFAANVRSAYEDAPGATASVRVFSPVTGMTYTMNCRKSGTGVTCSGGNNASVTF
jgi:hypothetical protein